ncbi:hypothetical protein ACS7SF_08470 [Ralstonia sp. 25C]|uniref:hypothetical protein n=1 Tax=Ralstonia sp. 25C TaxID=3447363 RepID=UPI003F750DFC
MRDKNRCTILLPVFHVGDTVDKTNDPGQDRQDGATPEAYASVDEAVRAITANGFRQMCSFLDGSAPVLNCQAAASIISEHADVLSLDGEHYFQLERATQAMPDHDAQQAVLRTLRKWADANWPVVVKTARSHAHKQFCGSRYFSSHNEFCTFIERWPRLRSDAPLRDLLLEAMEQGRCSLACSVQYLRYLDGDLAGAHTVLAIVMKKMSRSVERGFPKDAFAALMAQWAGDSTWGQLQHALWQEGEAEYAHVRTALEALPSNIVRVCALLHEFGITIVTNPDYALSELSPETRASWRRELKSVIGEDEALRAAATEALLWFGPTWLDRAILFAVLELNAGSLDSSLQPFEAHPDGLVRRRAHAVMGMARPEPDLVDLLTRRRETAGSAAEVPLPAVRTWIGDARIERLIESTLDEVAQEAGAVIGKTLHSGEEAHVMLVFERLRAAFSLITERLALLASETHANERLTLRLDYRVVGKQEEGDAGVGTDRFSTDICLIFEAREAGQRFARRASLLQAKRLYRNKNSPAVGYYPIKADQLGDLAGQTMASFLLLLGPTCEGTAIPVIPARLVLDLIERGEPSTQMAPAQASRLGKAIGTWLVEDIIGLWTGDWDDKIIARAQGGPDREPYLLVEVIVDRVQRDGDG